MFGGGHALDELGLERVVGSVLRGSDEKVSDFARDLWGERGNHIVELCLLRGDASGVELGLNLQEPDGGSVSQNEGNLILTAARVEGGAGVAASWVGCVSAMRAGVSSSNMITLWSLM